MKTGKNLLPQDRNLLAISFAVQTGITLLLMLILLIKTFSLSRLSKKETTLVQLNTGETLTAKTQQKYHRTNETLTRFIEKWLKLNFNIDGNLPNNKSKQDPGIEVENGNIIPTTVWMSRNMMQAGFGIEWSKTQPQIDYYRNGTSSTINQRFMGEPEQLSPRKWKIPVITDIIVLENGRVAKTISYNKTFTVQAIDRKPPDIFQEKSALDQALEEILDAGLEITEIEPYNL